MTNNVPSIFHNPENSQDKSNLVNFQNFTNFADFLDNGEIKERENRFYFVSGEFESEIKRDEDSQETFFFIKIGTIQFKQILLLEDFIEDTPSNRIGLS